MKLFKDLKYVGNNNITEYPEIERISCNDSLEDGDPVPDFDGCLGCSKYDECHS